MRVEWIQGMDLLELGELSDEGWIGPVVFRLLDDRGHLSGSLSAQRLHLEGSTSGRVVTIVLEDGEERTGGESLPFREGRRRIALPGVDPRPWIEALPELFDEESAVPKDDGRWDLERVRVELNRLLDEDATGDVFRMRHLGGVEDGVMRDVYFEVRDANGAVLRRLFADRCVILRREQGLVVQLEDGVIVRGDSRAPFLAGRYRVFLPRARTEAWERARLPGLVESESAPEVPAEADPEAPSPGDSVGMSSGRR